MKKVIKIGAFLCLGVLSLSSCKKNWVCSCQDQSDYLIKNQTKRKAEATCEGKVQIGLISTSGNTGCYISQAQ